MDQRRGMNHLDYRAELDGGGSIAARKAWGAEQEQGGAQTFAAALLKISADSGDGLDRGHGLDVDRFFDLFEVRAHKVEDLARGEDLPCTFSCHRKPSVYRVRHSFSKLAVVMAAMCSGVVWRTSASLRAVSIIMAGSLRFPRCGMGARYGASNLDEEARVIGVDAGGLADGFGGFDRSRLLRS